VLVNLSPEQREFASELRRFCAEAAPSAALRRAMQTESGLDATLWQRLTGELGLPGLAIPEAHGGQGFGVTELALAAAELGRALACAPFFSTAVMAARAVCHAATPAERAELLPELAAGATATLAVAEPGGSWDPADVAMQAVPTGAGFSVSGIKDFAIDGHTAQHVLVAARLPGTRGTEGLSLLLVEGAAPGLARRRLETWDPTRRLARLEFDRVPARRLGEPGGAGPALARTLDEATVALCAEMMGGTQRVLEEAVAHARSRFQFGRAVGSFQAVKHKCADVLIGYEAAATATREAAWAADSAPDELPLLASLAKVACSEAYCRATHENIQIHGGVGFTWEMDAHLFFRRARSSEILFGDTTWHRERIARAIGLGEAA
jgi:alkylation response protein AidB-like acyl-CoA dehydrogenase